MADTQVAKQQAQAVDSAQKTAPETIYAPDVDISENSECVRLVANIPGAEQQGVEVTVENNVLTVEASAAVEPPEGYEPLGREYAVGKYRRDFTLSNAVDTEGISAKVQHGVLEVTLPKREAVKMRRIEIGA